MKFITAIFCFYLITLTAIPTVRVIKMQFAEKCQSSCQKNNSEKETLPSGCQKQKCILNFNFNAGQYIVEQIQSISLNKELEIVDGNNLSYEKFFISKYQNSIWHPPKNIFFT